MIITEYKMSRELDDYAEYCTLSQIVVISGGMIGNYNQYNAPKYEVKEIKTIKTFSISIIQLCILMAITFT